MKQLFLIVINLIFITNCSVLTKKYKHDVCVYIEDGTNEITKNTRIKVKDTSKASLSGNIKVKDTKVSLENATIVLTDIISKKAYGEVTNENGNYSIKVPESRYELEVFYLGYTSHKDTIDINIDEMIILDLALGEAGGFHSCTITSKTKISQKKAINIAKEANKKS